MCVFANNCELGPAKALQCSINSVMIVHEEGQPLPIVLVALRNAVRKFSLGKNGALMEQGEVETESPAKISPYKGNKVLLSTENALLVLLLK